MKGQKQNQKRKYRRYDEAFKKNAVKLLEQGRSVSSVSDSLGVDVKNLYDWRRKYGSLYEQENAKDKEIKLLRKQLKQVQGERDILKKALSIFSRQTQF